MTPHAVAFDRWMRREFVEINSHLETLYFQQTDRERVEGVGEKEKKHLLHEGNRFITMLLEEGNTDEGFEAAFDLLGNVGMFMAACRRHELTEPSRETTSPLKEASALALHVGASLGLVPRFTAAHLTTHNRATEGVYRRFTDLPDEKIFVDYNTKGIFSFKRAADALIKILPLGISHPITKDLLKCAIQALKDVAHSNQELFQKLDADRFFYGVRPYYKPYRVGTQVFRGANAGDFADINVIDMILGLCEANDPSYSKTLVDKFLFMRPEDQNTLRDVMRRSSLMNEFLHEMGHHQDWYQEHLTLFLEACHVFGQTASQHQHALVKKYIVQPARSSSDEALSKMTASGPALHEVVNDLKNLMDRRCGLKRDDLRTRYEDLQKLRLTLR